MPGSFLHCLSGFQNGNWMAQIDAAASAIADRRPINPEKKSLNMKASRRKQK
jgi:hypothetical protein